MYKQVLLTSNLINIYRKQHSQLSHVRINKDTFGVMLIDSLNNNLIGLIQTDTSTKYILALEVFNGYKQNGYSTILLDIATKKLGIKYLSVNKSNVSALMVYKKYGFKGFNKDNTMYYMKIDKVSEVNHIIFGENHGNIEEIRNGYFKAIQTIKPEFYLHELIYEDKCLSKSDLKQRLDNTDKEGLCESWNKYIYEFAYKNNLKLIGIDLNESPDDIKKAFKLREKHMVSIINLYKSKKCIIQVGDTHLRTISTSELGNESLLYKEFNDSSLILRSYYGEIL